jgi:transcriptional regulator with XRE-family HTH domain
MISKIERLDCSPTAVTLSRLSGAFGLSMSELLLAGESGDRRLSRHEEQQVWQDPATGYTRRTVSPLAGLPLQLVEVFLPARRKVKFPALSYSALHQQIWLLEGRLTFHEGPEWHELHPGDCLQLAGAQDCAFENRSGSACRYVVALIVGK